MKEKLNVLLENSSAKKASILTVVLAVPLSGLLYFILLDTYNKPDDLPFWVNLIISLLTYIALLVAFFLLAYVVFRSWEYDKEIRSFVVNHLSTKNWTEIEISPTDIEDFYMASSLLNTLQHNNDKLFAKLNEKNKVVVCIFYPDGTSNKVLTTDVFSFYAKFKFKD